MNALRRFDSHLTSVRHRARRCVPGSVVVAISIALAVTACLAAEPADQIAPVAKVLARLDGPGSQDLEFSPDGSLLLVGGTIDVTKESCTTAVSVWDATTYKRVLGPIEFKAKLGAHSSFTSGGKLVLTYDWDEVRLWEPRTGKVVLQIPEKRGVWHAAIAPDESRIAVDVYKFNRYKDPHHIDVYDARTGKCIQSFEHPDFVDYFAAELSFSPDGSKLLFASYDNSQYKTEGTRFRVWDLQGGREAFEAIQTEPSFTHNNQRGGWACSRQNWNGSSFSPDGSRFIAEQSIRDVASGKPLIELRGQNLWSIGSAQFTPDGQHIIGRGEDIRLWDASGKPLAKPIPVSMIADFPLGLDQILTNRDGTRLYTQNGVWDTTTGRCIRRIEHEPMSMGKWAVSRDGRRFALSWQDPDTHEHIVLIWDVSE